MIGKSFHYLYNCVNSNDGEGISGMVEIAKQITWKTFLRNIPIEEVRQIFPTYSYRGETHNSITGELTAPFHIKDDWAVSFHSSTYRGRRCYYIQHSGIEYIWIKEDR
jgi:hypothetical protein